MEDSDVRRRGGDFPSSSVTYGLVDVASEHGCSLRSTSLHRPPWCTGSLIDSDYDHSLHLDFIKAVLFALFSIMLA